MRVRTPEAPKVKHPHPLMQQGTPPQDVEQDHILKFTVFRLGGTGAPTHVETLEPPGAFLDPGDVKRLVGGGQYQVKALANAHTSGRTHGSVITTTNYTWDGAPMIKSSAAQAPSASTPPQPSFFEQAASQGPAIVGAITAGLGGIMQIINSGREAREREERARREYEEAKRRDEREDRDRKEAQMRLDTEERREAERRRDEERRDKERAEAEERRAERDRVEQARLDQMRADSEARAQRETMLLNALMNRRDPNETIMQTLIQRAIAPTQPVAAGPSIDQVLGAAQKLKEFGDSGDKELIGMVVQALAPTPVGQEIIARGAALVGLYPKPEPQPPPVVTPEPPPMEQLPPAPMAAPPSPQPEIVPGPVTIN